MAITVKRKKDEQITSFLYRFNKAIQHSGVLRQAKANRFFTPKPNRNQRRKSAIYRAKMGKQIGGLRRAGILKGGENLKDIKKLLRDPKRTR